MDTQKIRINQDGEGKRLRYDDKCTLWQRPSNGVLVVKVPGGKHWAALGQPWRYHGAEFIVYRIVGETRNEDGTVTFEVEQITRFPVTRAF
jgi:hypothetical protein